MFQDITIEELLELYKSGDISLVDVRSPGEFKEFTIPGSYNIPLFTDEERAEIGTLYKQESVTAAKDKGLEVVSAKLPAFIKQFQEMPGDKAVFCWRGGMRSKTSATVLSLMGMKVYRLIGGIRTYRQWVVDTLESYEIKPKCVVISGNTGSGKTAILHQLASEGYPVVDIEALAQHRGSIFGQIGLEPSNQKNFEALLLLELSKWQDHPYIVMEAESRRVGKVVLPDFLIRAKEQGQQIVLDMPMESRVKFIMEDYEPAQHKQECLAAFRRIKNRIHTPIAAQIESYLLMDKFAEAVALLLEHYYDPRYEHAGQRYIQEPISLSVANLEDATEQIKQQLACLFP